jgi:tetratricopeptide (TPR) repeat protein
MAQKGLWQEAAYRWRSQLDKTGPSAALFNNLAIAAESAGNFSDAERFYDEALKLAPGHPVISDNRDQFHKLKKGELPPEDEEKKGKKGDRPARGEKK